MYIYVLHIYIYVYIYIYVHMCRSMCICYVHIYMYMYAFIRMICPYVCVLTYMYNYRPKSRILLTRGAPSFGGPGPKAQDEDLDPQQL